jgi:predicted flap endonuclease-1-like 5' DNA nuclease
VGFARRQECSQRIGWPGSFPRRQECSQFPRRQEQLENHTQNTQGCDKRASRLCPVTTAHNHAENKLSSGKNHHASFIRAPVTSELLDVPGIGPHNKIALTEAGVEKFLSLKGLNTSSQCQNDTMWNWLKEQGINSGRNNIILALFPRHL